MQGLTLRRITEVTKGAFYLSIPDPEGKDLCLDAEHAAQTGAKERAA